MKKKLTITVDEALLSRGKRYARARGESLSSIIEGVLRDLVGEETTFSERWRGRFEPTDHGDERYRAVAAKYL